MWFVHDKLTSLVGRGEGIDIKKASYTFVYRQHNRHKMGEFFVLRHHRKVIHVR